MTPSTSSPAAPEPLLRLACASDGRYLGHAAAMLHSALAAQAGAPTEAHILHAGDIRREQERALERMVRRLGGELHFHRVDPARLAGLPDWGRISTTMWHRIFLPELLPEADRVLYVDADVLVLAPLRELAGLDMDGHHLAAVTNVPERHLLDHASKLGLSGPRAYFNSGVLLMNLELMRRDDSGEALRRYAGEHARELLWPDQDALNIVLGATRLALHPRWNLMNSIRCFPWAADFFAPDELAEAIANPAIVHFEGPGPNKPWHLLCAHPLRTRYFEHRRQTPWPRCRREGLTPAGLARRAAQHFTAKRAV